MGHISVFYSQARNYFKFNHYLKKNTLKKLVEQNGKFIFKNEEHKQLSVSIIQYQQFWIAKNNN